MYQVRLEFQSGVRQKVSDTFTDSIFYIFSQISGNFVLLNFRYTYTPTLSDILLNPKDGVYTPPPPNNRLC